MSTDSQVAAAEHLIEQIDRIAAEAARNVTTHEAQAEGTQDFNRRIRYEEAAEFNRALRDEARRVVDLLNAGSTAAALLPAEAVLGEVLNERRRQLAKWGVQHRPDGTPAGAATYNAQLSKAACQRAEANGGATWDQVLSEEFFEAMAESDPQALRTELLQVAAVCVAWAEDIDSRTETGA